MVRILRIALWLVFGFSGYNALSQHVVISEVYGGGGNSGATFSSDYIELYNPTSFPVDIGGWSIQYAATAGTSWSAKAIPAETIIAPGKYFLIRMTAPGANGAAIPTPDFILGTATDMAGANGKVALVSVIAAQPSGSCPTTNVIDFVGYGTANCSEGTAAPALSSSLSAQRKNPCSDSENNSNDFKATLPDPQNSASTTLSPINFTSGYPKTQSVVATGFQVATNIEDGGFTYVVILPAGDPAPSSVQVKNGQNANDDPLTSDFKSTITNISGATEYTSAITGLVAETSYDVYAVVETCVLQNSPTKIQATTLSAADVTPPDYAVGYPKIQQVMGTGFQLASNLNESGKTYFVILSNGASAPSPSQVKSGQNASGLTLESTLRGEISLTNPNGEYTVNVSSLTSSTDYSVYFISEDLNSNLQSSVTQINVSTPTLFTEAFNDCNGTASFSSFSITGDQVWGCVDFGYNGTKGLRMNGFGAAAVENEDWLISPALNLNAEANLSFYSQFSFAGSALQLKVSTDYLGTGDPSSATWTDLNGNFPTVAVGSTSVALSDWTSSNVDLSVYVNQKIFLAFVYTSSSSSAARWTLDEINVTAGVPSYLTVIPAGLTFNSEGDVKSYTVKGVNLVNEVSITAPSDFTISKDNTTFGTSLSFTASEANANPVVYVKFTGTGTGNYSGSIRHTSVGVATRNVSLSGTDKSNTLNVAAYNLEFFGSNVADGSGEFGPVDDALQVSNVTTVLQTIGSDIFSVEEISDDASMDQLVSGLPGYDKIMADRWSYSFNPPDPTFPPQKIGFIYKTATVQVISSRVMFSKLYDDVRAAEAVSLTAALALLPNYPSSGGNTPSNFWSSGRLPFMVTADVMVNEVKKRIRFIVIHSKSGSAMADYERRKYDVQVLHDSLVTNYPHDNIMVMGDFNDDVDESINTGSPSSYKMFVDDAANFNVLTYALSQSGGYSFPSSSSFLDHIIISNELSADYVSNSIQVEDPRAYISGYASNTSDHLPVSARFALSKVSQTIAFIPIPTKTIGDAPFSLTATSTSNLAVSFSKTSDNVILTGSQVTIVKAGSVTIKASQLGDASYLEASVDQTFCINPAKPTITLSDIDTESPTLTSSATTGNQWYLNGTAITGATGVAYSTTAAGIYKVQVKADNCLSAFSNDTPLIVTGDIKDKQAAVSIYPNPAEDYLMITGLEANVNECMITDMTGRTSTLKLERQNGVHRAEIRGYSSGLYVVSVQSGNTVQQIKFIKK